MFDLEIWCKDMVIILRFKMDFDDFRSFFRRNGEKAIRCNAFNWNLTLFDFIDEIGLFIYEIQLFIDFICFISMKNVSLQQFLSIIDK